MTDTVVRRAVQAAPFVAVAIVTLLAGTLLYAAPELLTDIRSSATFASDMCVGLGATELDLCLDAVAISCASSTQIRIRPSSMVPLLLPCGRMG